ncbi:Alpha/Beta hydrolase protein [Blakeslea trispora]|nr:Alpha/Beta hydrolase protein [Blakeslea trispora]
MTLLSSTQISHQINNALLTKVRHKSTTIEPIVMYPRRVKMMKDSIVATTRSQHDSRGLQMPVTPCYVPPRAPIVLCHGLYGFDKIGPDALPYFQIQYWGGIENELAKLGAKVIVTKVPSTGSIWDRAQTLHSILTSIMEGQPLNFVAHSMGGLDCRYLISHIPNRDYKVNSLTTISTPHRGSPVMDWFRDNVGVGMAGVLAAAFQKNQSVPPALLAPLIKSDEQNSYLSWPLLSKSTHYNRIFQQFIRLLDTEAYHNLSTDYCKHHFNPNTPNDPNVAYYSYGANAKFPSWSLFNLPSQWIQEKEGLNDGLVSVESAKWGQYIKTLEADHWDLNGQR